MIAMDFVLTEYLDKVHEAKYFCAINHQNMEKKITDKEETPESFERRIEDIRQMLKKQELQMDILKKIIEKKEEPKSTN